MAGCGSVEGADGRAVPEAGWPGGIGIAGGAGGWGDLSAAQNAAVVEAFETGIAEDEIAHHLAGVVEGLAAEVDAVAADVRVKNARGEDDFPGAVVRCGCPNRRGATLKEHGGRSREEKDSKRVPAQDGTATRGKQAGRHRCL